MCCSGGVWFWESLGLLAVRRVIGFFLLVAFTFGSVDPFGWHLRCPMDNPLATAAMAHAGDMAGMDMGQDMTPFCHDHMMMPDPSSHSPAPKTPKHSQQCCCMGACCCSAILNVDGGRLVALPVVPVTVVRSTHVRRNEIAPAIRPDVELPPSVGPPTLRVG